MLEYLTSRGGKSDLQAVAHADLHRRNTDFFRKLIHLRFMYERRLQDAEAAVGTADRIVCINGISVDMDIRHVVRTGQMQAHLFGNKMTNGAVGTLIAVDSALDSQELSVCITAGLDMYKHRMPLGRGDHRFFSRPDHAHRASRLECKQRCGNLCVQIVFAAEAAASDLLLDMHHIYRHIEDRCELLAVAERILCGVEHVHDTVDIQIGNSCLRLDVGMIDALGRIIIFNDIRTFFPNAGHIALADHSMLQNVAGHVLVDERCAILQRIFHGEDRGQGLVFHTDGADGILTEFLGFRCDEGNGVSHHADLVLCQDGLVQNRKTEPVDARQVSGCHDTVDAFDRLCSTGIDGKDFCMRILAAQCFAIEHPRHFDVAGINRLTGDLDSGIFSDNAMANHALVGCIHAQPSSAAA